MSFYQVLNYIKFHSTWKTELIKLHLKNGKLYSNDRWSYECGRTDGYFSVFGQLFYILPGISKKSFICSDSQGWEINVYEL